MFVPGRFLAKRTLGLRSRRVKINIVISVSWRLLVAWPRQTVDCEKPGQNFIRDYQDVNIPGLPLCVCSREHKFNLILISAYKIRFDVDYLEYMYPYFDMLNLFISA